MKRVSAQAEFQPELKFQPGQTGCKCIQILARAVKRFPANGYLTSQAPSSTATHNIYLIL